MIISRGRRYIFVHIPKTAGTALALALEARAMADDLLIGDTPKAKRRKGRLAGLPARGRLWKHSTLADIEGVVSEAQMRDMFCFTMVRNPWDRLVSYYHWLKDQTFAHPAVGLAQTLSFEDFLRHPRIAEALRAAPAAHYMTDASGQEQANAYVRLEYLAQDLRAVERHLGFDLRLDVVNRSRRDRDFRRYYTDDLARHVAEICKMDITRFGYRFDDTSPGTVDVV